MSRSGGEEGQINVRKNWWRMRREMRKGWEGWRKGVKEERLEYERRIVRRKVSGKEGKGGRERRDGEWEGGK